MNAPKRHHTTSRFYLRRFAVKEEVIVVDRSDFLNARPTRLDDALVQRNFYSIPTEQGWDTTMETELAQKIEGPGSRAIARLVDERAALSLPGLRRGLSYLMAVQYLRGPLMREMVKQRDLAFYAKVAQTLTPEIVQAQERRRGNECTLKEARAIVKFARNPSQYTVEFPPIAGKKRGAEAILHVTEALPLADKIAPLLEQRNWTILEFTEPCLVTGDEPVVPVGDVERPGDSAHLSRVERIIFPLDPWHLLTMSRPSSSRHHERRSCDIGQAPRINQHVAFRCQRYVVHRPGTDPLAQMGPLPEKAPLVRTTGPYVLLHAGLSRNAAARTEALVRRRKRRQRKPH